MEPCFLCGKPNAEEQLGHSERGSMERFGVCSGCFAVCCLRSDVTALKLYLAASEALSVGYTDRGFAYNLWSAAKKKGLVLAACHIWMERNPIVVRGGYLCLSGPATNMPGAWLIGRSRSPVAKSLFDLVASEFAYFDIPKEAAWDGSGFWTAFQAGGEFVTHPTVAEALASQWGESRLPFQWLAAEGEPVGYEIIRRLLI